VHIVLPEIVDIPVADRPVRDPLLRRRDLQRLVVIALVARIPLQHLQRALVLPLYPRDGGLALDLLEEQAGLRNKATPISIHALVLLGPAGSGRQERRRHQNLPHRPASLTLSGLNR